MEPIRILVTGGAGFIGSHACKALSQAGHEPIVFDNLVHGHAGAVRFGPFAAGDILDTEALDRAMVAHKPSAVMHFAAFAYVGESVAEPLKYYRNDVAGTICLLEAMKRHDINTLVFSSTCATYGAPEDLPITEATPQRPINPYGRSKLAIEWVLADCAAAYGLRYAALRYFNSAGADPDGEIGEDHDPETHALPLAIKAALGSAPPFQVFGTDYDTPDGTAIRDYVHVSDLAAAHLLALEYLAGGGESCAFNLATGQGISVKQMIDAVEAAAGRPVPARFAPRRAGDPPVLYASAEKARSVLGWTPQFTDFPETAATAVRWFERRNS